MNIWAREDGQVGGLSILTDNSSDHLLLNLICVWKMYLCGTRQPASPNMNSRTASI